MNRFILQGTISAIKYLENSCIVYVDEYRKGYKKSNGDTVNEKYFQWKVVFKAHFKGYISKFFGEGMVVEIDAEMYPYAISNGNMIDGYSCIGKSIDISSFPKIGAKQEIKMIKDSQETGIGTPDLDAYKEPDF